MIRSSKNPNSLVHARNLIPILLCLALLVGVIVSGAALAAPTQIVVRTTLVQKERVDALKDVISKFEKANPNIKVKLEVASWNDAQTKTLAELASGTQPDVLTGGMGWAAMFAKMGVLAPLDGVVRQLGGQDVFEDSALKCSYMDGKQWGVPLYVNFSLVYYRKDYFASAGISAPSVSKQWGVPVYTWAEFEKVAQKLTGNGRYGFSFGAGRETHTMKPLYGLMLTNGVTVFDKEGKPSFNVPAAWEAMDYLARLAKYSPPGTKTYRQVDAGIAYKTGMAAMNYQASHFLEEIKHDAPQIVDKTGVFPLPIKKQPGHFAGIVDIMVFKSPRQAAAEKFVEFWFQDDNYRDFILSYPMMMLPTKTTVAKSAAYSNAIRRDDLSEIMPMALSVVKYGRTMGMEYGTNPYAAEIEGKMILADVVQRVLVDGWTSQKAFAEAEKRVKELMASK